MSGLPSKKPQRSSSNTKRPSQPALNKPTSAKPSASILIAKKKAQQKKKMNADTILVDHYQIAMESRNKIKGPTGLVTEPRMAEHRCLWDDKYPECPERLTGIIDRCRELNLIEQCEEIPPREATEEELYVLHSPSVREMLETTHENQDLEYLEDVSSKYDAIYIHPSTHSLALLAAGSTISLVDRVTQGALQTGAALVRPPGHHAMRAEPCGYCFYNNVALAARHAIDNRGLSRVLIVDFDVHHGQATQQMFYEDPRVVYFSIHRYEHGKFWPNLRQSNFNYIGAGRGKGYNFNVPLNTTGMSDGDYLAIWHQLLLPMAFEYQPQLILISAGYDAAIGCPEGEMEVTPACYASLVHMLLSVCPRVCAVLEGGYCLRSLAEGAALTLRTLLGHPPPALRPSPPSDSIRETILNCIYAHKRYWNCYQYQPTLSINPDVLSMGNLMKEKHTVEVKWEGDETRPDRFETRDCYPMQDDNTKREIDERLRQLEMDTDLSLPTHPVGYIYDAAMLKHKNICEPGHVENPERILGIHKKHEDFGLLRRVHQLEARRATDEEILSLHTQEYLEKLQALQSTKLRELNSQKKDYDSVYFHPDSLESAAVAFGCVLQAVEAVQSGLVGSCVCVVRPPGHHASPATASGFCLLNNVAGAASRASRAGARVLVLDWDVHHGDGTQRFTYDTDKILYISIHRYDNGSFFPHSKKGNYTAVGEGKGEGFNVNIPWNKRGMGDVEYLAAFTQIVLPIAYEYNPDLVLVSAGFDACVSDPLGGCNVTPECFGRMTQLIRGLAGGRVILCLEGGYNVNSISYAMTMCTKALLGDPITLQYNPRPLPHYSAVETINNVIETHSKYWKSLKFQIALPLEDVLDEPLPSRGLVIVDEDNISSVSSPISVKTIESSTDIYLEASLANLSLKVKCADGLHCGTDDEEDKEAKSLPTGSTIFKKEATLSKSTEPTSTANCTKTDTTTSSSQVAAVPTNSGVTEGAASSSGACTISIEPQPGSSTNEVTMTLVDYLAENMQAIVNEEMFAVIPLRWCPHVEQVADVPPGLRIEAGPCVECEELHENWVCLHCFVRACGRCVRGHMQAHAAARAHALCVSLLDLSAWCSACGAYVDHARLLPARDNAHFCKFGTHLPQYRPVLLDTPEPDSTRS